MNFVTAGLVPITCPRLPNGLRNHPGEGDDLGGGADQNSRANGTNHLRDYLPGRGRSGRVSSVRRSRCLHQGRV